MKDELSDSLTSKASGRVRRRPPISETPSWAFTWSSAVSPLRVCSETASTPSIAARAASTTRTWLTSSSGLIVTWTSVVGTGADGTTWGGRGRGQYGAVMAPGVATRRRVR